MSELEKKTMVAVNYGRLVFAAKLLTERKPSSKEMGEAQNKVLAVVNGLIVRTKEKGPIPYDDTNPKFVTLRTLLERPDYATPPAAWSTEEKPYVVPEFLVDFDRAKAQWEEWRAAVAAREADRRAKRAAAQAEANKAEVAAKAERARQAGEVISLVDGLSDLVAPDVKPDTDKAKEEDPRKKAGRVRIEKARSFLDKALRGELVAQGFRLRDGKWVVGNKDPRVLSLKGLADLGDNVQSMVDGSTVRGTIEDEWLDKRDGKHPFWYSMSVLVRLTDRDGRFLRNVEGKGFIVLTSREVTTLRIVAQEQGLLLQETKAMEGKAAITSEDVAAAQRKFWDTYHVQPLERSRSWARKILEGSGRGEERDGSGLPGRTVAESSPEDEGADSDTSGFEMNPYFSEERASIGRPAPRSSRKERDDRPKGVTSPKANEGPAVDESVDIDVEPEPGAEPESADEEAKMERAETEAQMAQLHRQASAAMVSNPFAGLAMGTSK